MDPHCVIRKAEFEDARDFSNLVSILGGQSLFRAWFGQYSYSALLEYSLLTLISYQSTECLGFLCISDSANSTDLQSFEPTLEAVNELIPVKVY